jgi:Ca2+:H+ antiporter
LIQGKIIIVKTSLIGSMLSNLLLVMGMSFFFGGINRVEQYFNVTVAQTAASLLALSIGSLIVPTVFRDWTNTDDTGALQDKVEALSRGTSIILLLVYACYLIFQLKSHRDMYNEPSKKVEKRKSKSLKEGEALGSLIQGGANFAASAGGQLNQQNLNSLKHEEEEEDDDEEEPMLTPIGAIVSLAISTTLVAFCSEFMVSAIDRITGPGSPLGQTFVGLILLPIVGNAAEHATAVTVAIKDKMDLSIGVAVGSSMQIALLVLPLIDVLGWIINKSDCHGNQMSLSFDGFQLAVLFVAVLLVNYLIQDGKSRKCPPWQICCDLLLTLHCRLA